MTARFDGGPADESGTDASIETLLGAYALDAVSDDERQQVEALLLRSPRARAELATLQTAVDALAAEAASAPPIGSWERLRNRLAEDDLNEDTDAGGAPPAAAMFPTGSLAGPVDPHGANPVSVPSATPSPSAPLEDGASASPPSVVPEPGDELGRRRAQRAAGAASPVASASPNRLRAWPLMAAAAAIVAVLMLGALVVRQGNRIDNLSSEMASGGIERSAQQALADPSSELVDLSGGDLKVNVRAAVTADGTGYLFAEDLPELPDDQTYQLWAARDDNVVSVGVLGNRPRVSAFQTATDAKALAITVEDAGGVVRSDHDPVAVGEFT